MIDALLKYGSLIAVGGVLIGGVVSHYNKPPPAAPKYILNGVDFSAFAGPCFGARIAVDWYNGVKDGRNTDAEASDDCRAEMIDATHALVHVTVEHGAWRTTATIYMHTKGGPLEWVAESYSESNKRLAVGR